jgi:ribosomal protein S18 acetylase RimI-like enzyme
MSALAYFSEIAQAESRIGSSVDDDSAVHRATIDEVECVRALFREYEASLDFDLCFQDFAEELADPFAYYVAIMLSKDGCVALRHLDEDTCEMKRLYVRSASRGRHLGRALAESIIRQGRDAGYSTMKLDTVPSMTEAISLYRSLGFKDTDAYRYNPIEGTLYLELDLTTSNLAPSRAALRNSVQPGKK